MAEQAPRAETQPKPSWRAFRDAVGFAALRVVTFGRIDHMLAAARAEGRALGLEEGKDIGRLEGVEVTARELAHVGNNNLTLAVGALELISTDPAVPPHLRELAQDGIEGTSSTIDLITRLQRLPRVIITESSVGPKLDSIASLAPLEPQQPSANPNQSKP